MFDLVDSEPIESPVQNTEEFRRVLGLPRRSWTLEQQEQAADYMTARLRTQGGTGKLWPVQGQALWEIEQCQGAFLPIRVGAGKTLISFLAPTVLQSLKPLLVMPANLIAPKKRELRAEAYNWQIPSWLRLESFTKLSLEQHANLLSSYAPDLIVLDESHNVKNKTAAATKRIHRYLLEQQETRKQWKDAGWPEDEILRRFPLCRVVAMTGTITNRSVKEFGHILQWCLGALAPVPRTWSDLEAWSEALDERKNRRNRPAGVLHQFSSAHDPEPGSLASVRRGFQSRLVDSFGVVSTKEGYFGAALTLQKTNIKPPQVVAEAIETAHTLAEAPDGWLLWDQLAVWALVRQLALGFYYRWEPRPPTDWMEARKRWGISVRYLIKHNKRRLDTELQIAQAVYAGHYDKQAIPDAEIKSVGEVYRAWKAIEPTFTPNPVPVWLDSFMIDRAATWLKKQKGIVWTSYKAYGRELERVTGVPFFAHKGFNSAGKHIEQHKGPAIASIKGCGTGLNLQHNHWRSLVQCPPTRNETWEQMLARTHRHGQPKDEVTFDLEFSCEEHRTGFDQALADARYFEEITGLEPKLLHCDILD